MDHEQFIKHKRSYDWQRPLLLFSLVFLSACLGVSAPVKKRPVVPTLVPPAAPTEISRVVTLIADPSPQAAAQPQSAQQPEVATTQPPAGVDPETETLLAMPVIEVTVTNGEDVNLRGGPGALYPIIGRVAGGAKLAVIGVSEHGEWLVLRHPDEANRVAWVYRLYTDYNPDRLKLPVIHNIPPTPEP